MTAPSAILAAQAALYGPTGADRIAELIEAADTLNGALQSLRTHPTPEGADRIASQLHGMHRSACQTVITLSREASQ